MGHPLLQHFDRFGLPLGRGFDEGPDFVGEEIRIAASHHHLWGGILLAKQLAEQSAAALLFHVRRGRCELRNGVGLDVLRPGERPQVGDELLLVPRREKRGEEDDVGDPRRQRRHGGVARIDQHEIRANLIANNALEN